MLGVNALTTHSIARQLTVNDADALRRMLALFGEAFEDRERYIEHQPDDAYLHRWLSNENFVAIASFTGGSLIGGLAGYVLPKFEQAQSEFYIYDLAVDINHRRQGVATGLIEALKQLCIKRGIYVIFVQADYGDDPAIALYTKLGKREDVMHFDITPESDAARN